MLGDQALEKFLTLPWERCLDIGSGAGEQAAVMREAGREVVTMDSDEGANPDLLAWFPEWELIYDPNSKVTFGDLRGFDAVWCCHVLEHQEDLGVFLRDLWIHTDGWLAITVPPAKPCVVPGHVTQWSAGLLLYNLVLAGFDCSRAMVKTYGYNVSVIVQKGRNTNAKVTDTLIDLAHFFPVPLTGNRPEIGELPADIESVNWD